MQGKGGKIPENTQIKSAKPTVIETTHGKIKPAGNINTVANSQQVSNNKFEASPLENGPAFHFQKHDSSSDSEVKENLLRVVVNV